MRRILIGAVLIVVDLACSKSDTGMSPLVVNQYPPITFRVTEKATASPVPGASVAFQICASYDAVFGCTAYSTVQSAGTGSDGVVTVQPTQIIEAIEVSKTHYWKYFSKNITDVELIPKAVVELSIKKENSYNSSDKLYVGLSLNDSHSIGLPADTTVYIDGYGNMDNQVNWYINTPNSGIGGSSPTFHINGFDTARVTIKY
jgi:hypothetical protein